MSNSFNLIIATLGNHFEVQQYFALIHTETFKTEIEKDLKLIACNSQSPDAFFTEHAKYIINLNNEQRQKIGLDMWLSLLEIIKSANPTTYDSMHKGTAFYHTGIAYLLNERWIEGFEWLDYAFEQDTKGNTDGNVELPATWTLSFDISLKERIKPNGVKELIKSNDFGISESILTDISKLFNNIKNSDPNFNISIDVFRNKIKSIFLDASSNRSIRSAWCTFLGNLMNEKHVLRYLRLGPKERCVQVNAHKSFVELTLILETLLKHQYSGNNSTQLGQLIIEVVAKKIFSKKIPNAKLFSEILRHDYTKILKDVKTAEINNDKLKVAYQLAYEIRNHSHHLFNEEEINEDVYSELFMRLCYAVIMTINKLY